MAVPASSACVGRGGLSGTASGSTGGAAGAVDVGDAVKDAVKDAADATTWHAAARRCGAGTAAAPRHGDADAAGRGGAGFEQAS